MSGLRIVGGTFGGRRLRVPPSTRPTTGRVREALMAIWTPSLPGSTVLELFAGSGAVGLEAIGRGAARAVLVERDPEALAVLEENVAALEVGDRCRVVSGELPAAATDLRGPFDLVFADPPYRFGAYDELLEVLSPLLAAGGEIAVEHADRGDWEPADIAGLTLLDTRHHGDSALSRFLLVTETS